MFCVHGVFKCNKLAVQINSGHDIYGSYKYLNCAADKTIDGGHPASTDCNY